MGAAAATIDAPFAAAKRRMEHRELTDERVAITSQLELSHMQYASHNGPLHSESVKAVFYPRDGLFPLQHRNGLQCNWDRLLLYD